MLPFSTTGWLQYSTECKSPILRRVYLLFYTSTCHVHTTHHNVLYYTSKHILCKDGASELVVKSEKQDFLCVPIFAELA